MKKNNQKEEPVRKEKNRIAKMADLMCETLIKRGFTVQRYDAYSTDSVYLKLDYGLCNSIRISDHNGKKDLSYMYNLRSDIKRDYTERNDFTQYFYMFKNFNKLINHICRNKTNKILKYGFEGYLQMMKIEQNLKKSNKGFWEKAYLVG